MKNTVHTSFQLYTIINGILIKNTHTTISKIIAQSIIEFMDILESRNHRKAHEMR